MSRELLGPARDLDSIVLIKGAERYVIIYACNMESGAEAVRTLGRWASNPDLSFTWYDACVLSQKIRERAKVS